MPETLPLAEFETLYRKIFDQLRADPRLKFLGDQIRTGTLQSVLTVGGVPVSYWNLNSGQFYTTNGTFTGQVTAGTVIGGLITGATFQGGLFSGTAVNIGDGNVTIDGPNSRILISDGTNNRVLIGKF